MFDPRNDDQSYNWLSFEYASSWDLPVTGKQALGLRNESEATVIPIQYRSLSSVNQ